MIHSEKWISFSFQVRSIVVVFIFFLPLVELIGISFGFWTIMSLSARSRSVRYDGKLESVSLSVRMKKDLNFCFLSGHGHVK